jgi:hypothetical protein
MLVTLDACSRASYGCMNTATSQPPPDQQLLNSACLCN